MLGRLRMTVQECIEVFRNISRDVFGSTPGLLSKVFDGARGKPFFKGERLEQVVKDILKARGLDQDTLLKESRDSPCKM